MQRSSLKVTLKLSMNCALATVAAFSCLDPVKAAPTHVATLQTIMRTQVDASADAIWGAVETVVTRQGEQTRQPHTKSQWAALRRHAQVLIAASQRLQVPHRRVSLQPFPAEAQGALSSGEVERRIEANWPAFVAFAQLLERTATEQLPAIDAHDVPALVAVGGRIETICERCHLTFWYPGQVIPALPAEN